MSSAATSLSLSHLHGMAAESLPSSSLALLTRRMASGEEGAFAEFHAVYARRLFRYVLVLQRGDEHSACDVLQETLLRVARYVRSFEEEPVFWNWLTRLARSAAADHGRKGRRYLRFLERFTGHALDTVPEPGDKPLSVILDLALTQLPETESTLLQAKYHRGQSVRDIAAAEQVSEAAIESRLARARNTLRQLAFQLLNQHPAD